MVLQYLRGELALESPPFWKRKKLGLWICDGEIDTLSRFVPFFVSAKDMQGEVWAFEMRGKGKNMLFKGGYTVFGTGCGICRSQERQEGHQGAGKGPLQCRRWMGSVGCVTSTGRRGFASGERCLSKSSVFCPGGAASGHKWWQFHPELSGKAGARSCFSLSRQLVSYTLQSSVSQTRFGERVFLFCFVLLFKKKKNLEIPLGLMLLENITETI